MRTRLAPLTCFIALLLACIPLTLTGQPTGLEYERVLFPVAPTFGPRGGLFGAIWQPELWMVNRGAVGVHILGFDDGCSFLCPPIDRTPANITLRPHTLAPAINRGWLFLVEKPLADLVDFSFRLRERSRPANHQGTLLPVVRERDLKTGTINLTGIELDEGRYRYSLRVYDPDRRGGAQVRLRIFRINPALEYPRRLTSLDRKFEAPLIQTVVTLTQIDNSFAPGFSELIGFAATFPQLLGISHIRIELAPITPNLRFWALVSIIDNDSQSVTFITPQ